MDRQSNVVEAKGSTETLGESPIIPKSIDAGKREPRGQASVASALAPGTMTPQRNEESSGVMAMAEAEDMEAEEQEEVPDARTPTTKRAPVGMTVAEWNVHRLTHLPYNAACRCCVAGRKRDDQHRRRESGPLQAQADMDE